MPTPTNDPKQPTTIREPYEAPVIEDVPIRAAEQLLAGCKTAVSGGADPLFCASCSAPSPS
jgi:hypothetical protein